MTRRRIDVVALALLMCTMLAVAGCSWQGVNSVPLPGTEGRGSGSQLFHVQMANVSTLVSNSPVMIDDVVVGSIGDMTVSAWHANVEVWVDGEVVVPGNAQARIGQTSLLGSNHLELNPPDGESPTGQLLSGATILLDSTATYPSTEQTLASVSAIVNGGGLGEIDNIISSLNTALDGREESVHDLITRLDTFVGALDQQRDNIVDTIKNADRLAETFATQRDVLSVALQKIPPALEVLVRERPQLTTALEKLRVFSDTAGGVISSVQEDLVTDLQNLAPTLRSLADVGPQLDKGIAFTTVFPYGQKTIDRAVRGDYFNLHATVDLTVERLQRELLLGTPLGDPNAVVQAAVGDPGYGRYVRDPLSAPISGGGR
ncbi:MCE family protein [Williamsia sp.]|uniref:MCE family protein n=1 Tax=Williamsia sp. TaxID=1872085 RepID=UPI002F9368B4